MKTYQSTTNRNRITLNQKTRYTIPINFVVMLIADVNYTNFIMIDGSKHLVSHPLRYFEPFLEIHGFHRIRRGSMINSIFMKEYCHETSMVSMRNGMFVKVARRKKEAFLVAIKNEGLGQF